MLSHTEEIWGVINISRRLQKLIEQFNSIYFAAIHLFIEA